MDTTWGTDNDLWTLLESLYFIADGGSTTTGMTLDVHEVANGDNDLLNLLGQPTGWGEDQSLALLGVWVQLLEDGDRESGSPSVTRFGLDNNIMVYSSVSSNMWQTKISKSLLLMTGMIARC